MHVREPSLFMGGGGGANPKIARTQQSGHLFAPPLNLLALKFMLSPNLHRPPPPINSNRSLMHRYHRYGNASKQTTEEISFLGSLEDSIFYSTARYFD